MDKKPEESGEMFSLSFTFFYRDAELDVKLQELYRTGQIIRNPSFTDMTHIGSGMATSFRYLIASRYAKDISMLAGAPAATGMAMLPSGCYFKVLDVYRHGGKTQVLLWDMGSENTEYNELPAEAEQAMVLTGRQDFHALQYARLEPSLQTDQWLERTSHPLGINNKGVFYPLQPPKNFPAGNDSKKSENFWTRLFKK